jgi:hypothetical protein
VNVPTDRRAVVKVQVRLSTASITAPSTRQIGGYTVIIVGEAKASDWPNFKAGDLEGVVWTIPRNVAQVMRNLTGQPGVVDLRGEAESGP